MSLKCARCGGLGKGKPYNGEYAELFLNRMRDENLFENLGSTKTNPDGI